MKTFIRFDVKGTFRGSEHVSTFTDESYTEPGISCYELNAEGVKNLIRYWTTLACLTRIEDYENMNLTVFAGEKVGTGTDFEDCATCTEVLGEIDAAEFFEKYLETEERYFDEEITEDEMYETLEKYIREAIA